MTDCDLPRWQSRRVLSSLHHLLFRSCSLFSIPALSILSEFRLLHLMARTHRQDQAKGASSASTGTSREPQSLATNLLPAPTPPATSSAPSTQVANSSSPELPADGAADWTESDETRFIDFLVEHKSEAGDGGNFGMRTFKPASVYLEKFRTKGGPKTPLSCKGKLASVCPFVCFIAGLG